MSETRHDTDLGPAVDPAALEELRAFSEPGEDDIVAELIQIFLDDCPERLEDIRAAVAGGDPTTISKAAHALKSGCGQLGAMRMAELCQTLESNGKAGSTEGAEAFATQLFDEFERVKTALSAQM